MEKKEAKDLEKEIVKFLKDPKVPASDKTLKGILNHVDSHKEIEKSKQERAKKDKIRRIIDNSLKIHGYGNTRNKRYKVSFSEFEEEVRIWGFDIEKVRGVSYTIQNEVFKYHSEHNKPIDNLAEFCQQRVLDWEATLGFDINQRLIDLLINGLEEIYPDWVDYGITLDFTYSDDEHLALRYAPEHWFVPGSAFAGSAYIGFQGPELLTTIISNIVRNIDYLGDDILEWVGYDDEENLSNIWKELHWVINNKRTRLEQHKNKIAITLALLHLNQSLLDLVTPMKKKKQ